MEQRVEQYEIKFDAAKIVGCFRHISETNNVVSAIYHSTKDFQAQLILPLDTDGLAFVFPDANGETHINAEKIHDWVFRKAFEDFIIGMSQSLIEAYKLLKIVALGKVTQGEPFKGKQEAEKALKKLDSTAQRLKFFDLVREIEKELDCELPLKEEILSINKVRNCLVHRGGTVSEADINDTATNVLRLKYQDLKIYIQVAGKIIELTKEAKEKHKEIEDLLYGRVNNEIVFQLNEKVALNPTVFKNIAYTTIMFIQELVMRLPIPEDKKRTLVPPIMVQVVGRKK